MYSLSNKRILDEHKYFFKNIKISYSNNSKLLNDGVNIYIYIYFESNF